MIKKKGEYIVCLAVMYGVKPAVTLRVKKNRRSSESLARRRRRESLTPDTHRLTDTQYPFPSTQTFFFPFLIVIIIILNTR